MVYHSSFGQKLGRLCKVAKTGHNTKTHYLYRQAILGNCRRWNVRRGTWTWRNRPKGKNRRHCRMRKNRNGTKYRSRPLRFYRLCSTIQPQNSHCRLRGKCQRRGRNMGCSYCKPGSSKNTSEGKHCEKTWRKPTWRQLLANITSGKKENREKIIHHKKFMTKQNSRFPKETNYFSKSIGERFWYIWAWYW